MIFKTMLLHKLVPDGEKNMDEKKGGKKKQKFTEYKYLHLCVAALTSS
jgi:hypothetical protein